MYISEYFVLLHVQVKQYKQATTIPTITKTPGDFEGAQFNIKDLIFETAELEERTFPACMHTYR